MQQADILTPEDLEYLLESLDMAHKSWFGYGEILKHIPVVYQRHAKPQSKPQNTIVNVPYPVYEGFIQVEAKYTHRGGYYGFNRYLPYALKVGSNVDSKVHKEISDYVQRVSEIFKDHLRIDSENPHFHSSSGTAFSTYGLAV